MARRGCADRRGAGRATDLPDLAFTLRISGGRGVLLGVRAAPEPLLFGEGAGIGVADRGVLPALGRYGMGDSTAGCAVVRRRCVGGGAAGGLDRRWRWA